MGKLLQVIGEELLSTSENILKKYIQKKYGQKTMICIVRGDKGHIFAELDGQVFPVPEKTKKEPGWVIRAQCGEYALMRHGLPKNTDDIIPLVVLIPTLSLLKTLGLVNTIMFLKSWRGSSSVPAIESEHSITSVRYQIL